MTNAIAIGLVLVIGLGLGADAIWNDGMAGMFLARKFAALIEWMAFWR
ncbi:MAG: hypothetical protein JKP98_08225 [Rhodobacteraceae bacterium]|nr:hypothetical protein [Paracoccaceae bacterium]MBL4557115.1 hypothetical protein [Paracoccaceae bacterium]